MPDPRFEARLREDRPGERWSWWTLASVHSGSAGGLALWQERLDRSPVGGGDGRSAGLVLTRR